MALRERGQSRTSAGPNGQAPALQNQLENQLHLRTSTLYYGRKEISKMKNREEWEEVRNGSHPTFPCLAGSCSEAPRRSGWGGGLMVAATALFAGSQ